MLSIPLTTDNKIDITDLTHSVVEGNGVFDKLMKAVSAHLEQEFQKGRIKGTEYSTVYLSALQGVLEVSLQFVLQKEKASKELEILEQQKINLELEAVNIPKQGLVLDKQAVDLEQSTALKAAQTANAVIEGTVLTNTAAKVTAEKDLLLQRKISEEAQVNPANILPGSVIAKNIDLVSAQTTGYTRDAEQKAAKIMADAFAVQATVDENTLTTIGTANLSATDIGSVITKLKTGIGI